MVGATLGSPMCSKIRSTRAGAVTAATISIRPAHRAHSKTSFKNTRQISEAHGDLAVRPQSDTCLKLDTRERPTWDALPRVRDRNDRRSRASASRIAALE